MVYKPPTIEDIGLEKWLTDKGYDYAQFVQYADDYIQGIVSLAAVARKMDDADPRTVARWIAIYKIGKE